MTTPAHVFISYARADAADIAKRLYDDLTRAGYAVWQDKRDLNPDRPFDSEIETAIKVASALIVFVTSDVSREDSFVRREIAYALEVGTRIIPLKCPGGVMPITINLLTWIPFEDYDVGLPLILERLKRPDVPVTAQSRRVRELAYLQDVGQKYEKWLYLYTDLTGRVEKPTDKPKVAVKAHALKYLNTQNTVYRERGFIESGETQQVETVNELRRVLRKGGGVLIGDPGCGKTTTLHRLCYEFAVVAAEQDYTLLPIFVPLGAYNGGGLNTYIEAQFGALSLRDYLPKRAIILFDGLNEMSRQYVDELDGWLRSHTDVLTIVTCRRLDYVKLKALPLRRIDISPLDPVRIWLFIGNWLEDYDRDRLFWTLAGDKLTEMWGYFRKAGLGIREFWQGRTLDRTHPAYKYTPSDASDKHYNSVRAAIHQRDELPELLGLMANPFLLNITIDIYIANSNPPENRGQLYRAFVDLLIEKRGRLAISAVHPWIEPMTQVQALSALAYRMQAEGMGTKVSLIWARDVVQAFFNDNAIEEDVNNLMYLAESATLLIVDNANNEVKFFHQMLQEYCASLRLGQLIFGDEVWVANPDKVSILSNGLSVADLWPDGAWWNLNGWEETIVLLAGLVQGVTKWLLPAHPILACRALTEGLPDSDMVKPVQDALIHAMTSLNDLGDYIVPVRSRVEVGRTINRIGDSRPGVGLIVVPRRDKRAESDIIIPDIAWSHVPAGTVLSNDNKRTIIIDYDYKIAKYPVTNVQFQSFMNDPDGYNNPNWWTQSGLLWKGNRIAPDAYDDPVFRLPNHPRIYVYWDEAYAYTQWLTSKLGYYVRLPTDQEWDKASRGVYLGENNTDEISIRQTNAVGIFSKDKSAYGVMDLVSNIWEWCWDGYEILNEMVIDDNNEWRVVRGGLWDRSLINAQAAFRLYDHPSNRYGLISFRLCCPTSI